MKLLIRRIISAVLPTVGHGSCYRCYRPWNWTKSHTTYFTDSRGCFALCETCWSELTPAQRLPFYSRLMFGWQEYNTQETWNQISAAVLEGK